MRNSPEVKAWLDAAGKRKISAAQTELLLQKLSTLEKGTPKYKRLVDRICEGNLLLIPRVATKMTTARRSITSNNHMMVDLLQVGYFGLLEGATRFDPARGYKFSTVAYPWIRQRLNRWMYKHENLIYIPENTLRAAHAKLKGGKVNWKGAPKNSESIDKAMQALCVKSADSTIQGKNCARNRDARLIDLIVNPSKDEEPTPMEQRLKPLYEVMDKAGLDPTAKALMVEYAKRGNKTIAGYKVKCGENRAYRIINESIEKCKQHACDILF